MHTSLESDMSRGTFDASCNFMEWLDYNICLEVWVSWRVDLPPCPLESWPPSLPIRATWHNRQVVEKAIIIWSLCNKN